MRMTSHTLAETLALFDRASSGGGSPSRAHERAGRAAQAMPPVRPVEAIVGAQPVRRQ